MFSAPVNPVLAPPARFESVKREPVSEDDVGRIIDVYGYQSCASGSGFIAGGAGAYCYYGSPHLARLGGTPLERWADDLLNVAADASSVRGEQREDYRVVHAGRAYRALREDSDQGTHISLRRLADETPKLDALSTDTPAIRTLLEGEWLNDGGLVVFAGLPGQGKTTFAGATVRTRLELFGGRCIGVEDVVEMPLEGLWGGGSCRQILVDYAHPDPFRRGFAGAIRKAYRSMPATRPAILLVGEVRDSETAEEVVKAAANGMLVLTTTHATDPISAIMRLWSLAERSMGAEGAASNLAHGLRMVVHQSMKLDADLQGWRRGRCTVSALVSSGPSSGVGHLLQGGKLNLLAGELAFQTTLLRQATYQRPLAHQLLNLICRGKNTHTA